MFSCTSGFNVDSLITAHVELYRCVTSCFERLFGIRDWTEVDRMTECQSVGVAFRKTNYPVEQIRGVQLVIFVDWSLVRPLKGYGEKG